MISTKKILFVSGLGERVTEEILHSVFIPFGDIMFVKLPKSHFNDNRGRGYGFVEFEEPEDAKHALDNVHNSELFGTTLKVTYAKKEDMEKETILEVNEDDAETSENSKETDENKSNEEDQMNDEDDVESKEPEKKKRKLE